MTLKKITWFCFAAFVVLAMSCSNSASKTSESDSTKTAANTNESSNTASKKYDIKSGIVTYKASVMGIENTQTLYFDDYGAKEMKESITEMSIMGIKTRKVDVSLEKEGYRYEYELENMTNNENKLTKEIKKTKIYSAGSSDMAAMATTLSDEMKKKYEYKEEGTEAVAGVTGTKVSMKMGKTAITAVMYKKVMLKTVMEMIKITATKFEENVAIPADKFELPKDYTIIEK
jgi:hypothetical protein